MSEEHIGIIEQINGGHGSFRLFGIKLWGARGDQLCISKFYDLNWRNLFRYKQIGTYNVINSPPIYKERDIVKVTIDNKRITSVIKTGTLTRTDATKHTFLGEGALSIIIILFIMAGIVVWGL